MDTQSSSETWMDWHAKARITSSSTFKPILAAIFVPCFLLASLVGIVNGWTFGPLEGVKIFAILCGVFLAFFAFVLLILLAIKPSIRMRYILNETGVYAMEDDEVARQLIAAGGAFGVATGNVTMIATPLAAKAGQNGHLSWDKVDIVWERPVQNLFILKRPGWWRPDFTIFATQENYRQVKDFIKRHKGRTNKMTQGIESEASQ